MRFLFCLIMIKRVWYMIVFMWIILVMLLMGLLFGWGYFDYNFIMLLCGVVYLVLIFDRFYLLIFVLLVYVIFFLSMVYVYMRILFVVCKYIDRIVRYIIGGFEVMRL